MKKTLKIVGIAMLSMAMFFVSCKQEAENTVTAVENPEITVKAYPGVNYLYWSPSVDGSVKSIFRNDGVKIHFSPDGNFVYDTNVEDGVDYTYTFYTDSKTNMTLEYIAGNKASASVKAIKPAYFDDAGNQTSALSLAYYENGTYNADAAKDFIVTADNIKVNLDSKQKYIFVQVPQKDYLNYTVKIYKGNAVMCEVMPELMMNDSATDASRLAIRTEKTVTYSAPILAAGEYRVGVTVSSPDNKYATERIIAKDPVSIEAIVVDQNNQTSNVNAAYKDTSNKEVRVTWTPAKDNDGNRYPVANYTVYAFDDNTRMFTKVAETPKASKSSNNDDIYYVDTKTIGKKYFVVLSVNGKYENIRGKDNNGLYLNYIYENVWGWKNWVDLTEYKEITSNDGISESVIFTDADSDNKYNDVKFSVSGFDVNDKRKVVVKYFDYDPEEKNWNNFERYFVSDDYSKTAELEKVAVKNENTILYYQYEGTVRNISKGNKVAYQVTISETGKQDNVSYSTTWNVAD